MVNKPAGLLTHPEKAEDRDTLTDQILYYLYEKGQYTPSAESAFTPAVCNRLDRNTSGIVVAGKTLRAVQAVNEAIRSRRMDKYYVTLVKGVVEAAREIDLPVMATKMTTYTACGELYLHGLPGTKEKPQS